MIEGKPNFKKVPYADLHVICETSGSHLRPLVPQSLRKAVFDQLHNIGHPGVKNSVKLIGLRYFWPKMSDDITKWCRNCLTCQQEKVTKHTKPAWQEMPHPSHRFATVHLDIVGPLTPSKVTSSHHQSYQYLVTFIDRYTRWIEAVPTLGYVRKKLRTLL